MLNHTLTYIRKNNLYNSMTKEVLGSNLPHLALVMNRYELADQAIVQLTNTLNVFGFSQLMAKLYDVLFARLWRAKTVPAESRIWQHLGKTAWCHGQIISFMLAMPALRNALMTQFSKTTRFVDMVGLNGAVEEPPEKVKAAVKQNLNTFFRFYSTGMAVTAALTAGLAMLAKQGKSVPRAAQAFYRTFGLPDGNYRNMKDAAAILFWAYPVYLGWWIHSRDKSESIETAVKAGGFAFAFSIIPRLLEKTTRNVLKGKSHAENKAFLLQIFSACLFYTALPTTANLLFRRKRAAKLGLLNETPVNAQRVESHAITTHPPVFESFTI
jgi:hypothetical protein